MSQAAEPDRAAEPRRILVVHNRYTLRGGEDAVVEAEVELLTSRGHHVELYLRDNQELAAGGSLSAAAQTLWSTRTVREVSALTRSFRPDIIHAHNTFPLVSPALYWSAAHARVALVQTLHNFRLICPQAMLLREQRVCEDCLGKLPWRAVLHRCYRDSVTQSAVATGMLGVHRLLKTYHHKIARYIALNEFCRRKFVEGGLPAERIVVKPNFVDLPAPEQQPRKGALFVGRLAGEKGIGVLLAALDLHTALRIDVIGSGPDAEKFAAHPRVTLLGWQPASAVRRAMQHAAFLLMPSIWYETFGLVALEAFACGLPVIGSNLGSIPELVQHGKTGLLFEPGSAPDLVTKIRWAEEHEEEMSQMGRNARLEYEANYTPARNYQSLMAIYAQAIQSGLAPKRSLRAGAPQ